ncbi:MAG: hypothetical protein IKV87_06070, partial [Methanobrevibacter sp.]|nr:hypothetical protein [Methanobrevibacter sp.]
VLTILIVIYVGINLAYNGLDTINGITSFNIHDALNIGGGEVNKDGIIVGDSSIAKLENYTDKKISDNEVRLTDYGNDIAINVKQLDDSANIKDTVSKLLAEDTEITSNQAISQSGVTAYFIYKETVENYDAEIYFNKDGKNYLITGEDIAYSNSDNFINACKEIINSMGPSGEIEYSRY